MENVNEEIRGCFKVIDGYLGTMQQMHADTGTQCLVRFDKFYIRLYTGRAKKRF